MRRCWAALCMAFLSPLAQSHDLWIEKEGQTYTLLQGHRHSSHTGADVVPYEPSAVKNWNCVDANGSRRNSGSAKSYPAQWKTPCTTLLATFSTGYWTKTPWETRNAPKTGIQGALKSWYSEESLKLIERWTASSNSPFSEGLEITPIDNPLVLRVGDKLTVLVTQKGKPVAGLPVAYAGDTRGATGEDGKVAIRLRQPGLQLISTSQEVPLNDGKADIAIRSASLQFEVAP